MKDWLYPLIGAGFALGISIQLYNNGEWSCILFAWFSGALSTFAFVAYVQYKANQFHYRP